MALTATGTLVQDELVRDIIVWYRWVTPFSDACPKCLGLTNYMWRSEGTELLDILEHPLYGPVWDVVSDYPVTHENCRCHIDYELSILYGGSYLDYLQIKYELENIRRLNQELAETGAVGIGGDIGDEFTMYNIRRLSRGPFYASELMQGNIPPGLMYSIFRYGGRAIGAAGPVLAAGFAAYEVARAIWDNYDNQYKFWEKQLRRERDEEWRRGLIP